MMDQMEDVDHVGDLDGQLILSLSGSHDLA